MFLENAVIFKTAIVKTNFLWYKGVRFLQENIKVGVLSTYGKAQQPVVICTSPGC